jgi:hypothetical protein
LRNRFGSRLWVKSEGLRNLNVADSRKPKLPSLESLPSFCSGCGWTARNSNVQSTCRLAQREISPDPFKDIWRWVSVGVLSALGQTCRGAFGTRSGASSPLTAYVPDMSNLFGIALDPSWLQWAAAEGVTKRHRRRRSTDEWFCPCITNGRSVWFGP